MKLIKLFAILCLFITSLFSIKAQDVIVEGYVYELGNRGYLKNVQIEVLELPTKILRGNVFTDKSGFFTLHLPQNKSFIIQAVKKSYNTQELEIKTDVTNSQKKFVKIEMERMPGYNFEVTLAPKRENEDVIVEGIEGAWIEVYNNTEEKEVLNIKNHPSKEFNVHFEQGNHYTIMIRKDGYFNKRMEAYVNIKGCILCFEGIGEVNPGVVDNLTSNNEYGVLLANVELEPLFSGRKFEIENLYYDFGKVTLRPEAKEALKQLATVLQDNPHVKIELGSHTDSRDSDAVNLTLSQKRAKSAVDYLVNTLDVRRSNIIYNGYGESQLVNECEDGVECTEEQHQENRRTEITILNIDGNKKLEKPLSQIRKEEMFKERILQGEVETYQADTIAMDDIKQIENEDMKNEEVTKEIVTIEIEKDEIRVEREKVMPNKVKEQITKESQIKTEKYTGYRIVIYESNSQNLPEKANIFSNITEYSPAPHLFIYMIGRFNTEKEAVEYQKTNVKEVFPDAYIIKLNNGKRTK